MTGLERNADVVNLVSYAPLFAHVDAWQWSPDLIWFNNLTSFGTANYYVQKLFSNNKGTNTVSIEQDKKPLTGQNGLYASAVIDKKSGELIVKIVNTSSGAQNKTIQIQTLSKPDSKALLTVLKDSKLAAMNTIDKPDAVKPVESEVPIKGKNAELLIAPYSVTVVKIKLN